MAYISRTPITNIQSERIAHPRNGLSLSVAGGNIGGSPMSDYTPDTDIVLEDIEDIEPVGRIETAAIPPRTACGVPFLPSNKNIKFVGDLEAAVKIFTNPSKDVRARISSQRLAERVLIEKGRCSNINPAIVNDSRLHIFSVDDGKLETLLGSPNGLNASIHDNISCTLDAIIYEGKEPGLYSPLMRERIRNWFPHLKQIGPESVEGYALASSFSQDSNLFVIKAPRNPKNDELVHEAVVGFYALNKLRHVLPNYMYVYGYTKCSPPALKNKEAITWCSSSNPAVSYLITENIRDSVSIGDFVVDSKITPNDFLAVFLQLINALNLAYKHYGYTHYDLHRGNVMIRKYKNIVAIPYFGTSGNIQGYIASRYVPYIIDYGYSCVNIGGVGFGKIGLENYGVTSQPFPMFDTYKIIGFLAEEAYRSSHIAVPGSNNGIVVQILDRLFSFFNEGSVRARVLARLNNDDDYYNYNRLYQSVTHDDYLKWLETTSGITLPIHRDLAPLISRGVFAAPIATSLDTCRFYSLVASESGPETALEYCEVVSAIKADSVMSMTHKDNFLSWLTLHFDAEEYFNKTLPSINEDITDANELKAGNIVTGKNIVPKLSGTPNTATTQFITMYKSHIFALLRIKDIASNLVSYIRAAICSLATQNKISQHKSTLERLDIIATDMVNFVNNNRQILKTNVQYANSLNWDSLTSDTNVINFWNVEHETLVLAV